MEFVDGRTLKEVLAAEGRLQPRRALEICADICAALEFSHRHGIIHRDIKPGNVMLTQTGQVKVMDFGIARALASGATTMTQTSAVIGTAQYLSPEQARGEAVDARSDLYAGGCVLFELVCGHPPFVGDSPVASRTSTYGRRRRRRATSTRTSPRPSTRSCSRRCRRTRSTATRALARCGPTCSAPPPAGPCWPPRCCARRRLWRWPRPAVGAATAFRPWAADRADPGPGGRPPSAQGVLLADRDVQRGRRTGGDCPGRSPALEHAEGQ